MIAYPFDIQLQPGAPTSVRLQHKFATIRAKQRGGLIVFVTAADPTPDTSLAIIKGLPRIGVDIIELGVPFSDPMADGPAIQAASQRALRVGGSLACTLKMARAFRTEDNTTPLILMSYYNPIYIYGPERFATDAAASGIDGCIVVDLPPEEADELWYSLKARGLDFIFMATPTTNYARLPIVLGKASGFIYYISINGITGTKSATQQDITHGVLQLRHKTELPIAVGFGIKTPEQVIVAASIADAAVVGSAVVLRIAAGLNTEGHPRFDIVEDVLSFVRRLAVAASSARPVVCDLLALSS